MLPVGEDLLQGLGAQDGPQGGAGEQPGGHGGVGHVAHGGHRRGDLVVADGIHGHSDAVLGEDLLRRHVEGHRPEGR